jgi:uncharacterized protein YbaR (Trm112 family)
VIEPWLLDLLVCPQCKGELTHETEPEESLVCGHCRLRYEVRENIPILLIDEAVPLA